VLHLTRKPGEAIQIGPYLLKVKAIKGHGTRVEVAVAAPTHVRVQRAAPLHLQAAHAQLKAARHAAAG